MYDIRFFTNSLFFAAETLDIRTFLKRMIFMSCQLFIIFNNRICLLLRLSQSTEKYMQKVDVLSTWKILEKYQNMYKKNADYSIYIKRK